MKIKLARSVQLHLGTPWRNGSLCFSSEGVRDWSIKRVWGISWVRHPHCFVGIIRLTPKEPTDVLL